MDDRPTCQRCLSDYEWPEGRERPAVIQLVGEWLCDFHYERALETESAYIKTRVRQSL